MLVLLSGLAATAGLSMAQAQPTKELFEDLNLDELMVVQKNQTAKSPILESV